MDNGGQWPDLQDTGAEPLDDEDPRDIGPYELIGVLGTGGMGRVFLGHDRVRLAAIKVIRPELVGDDSFLLHFGRELDNLARLPLGLSAQLLASERSGRHPWFATEYVPGLTVLEAVRTLGAGLPAPSLWLLLREAAKSLERIHALDMIHRDLKPSNVILTTDGLKVIDFGVARALEQSKLTLTGQTVGTPAYMAPEQVAGDALTGAVDVFGLASLIVMAATLCPPFGDGQGIDVLYRVVNNAPDLSALAEIDQALADVVERCLAKNPRERPTAAQILEEATRALAAESGPVRWPQDVRARISKRLAFVTATASWPTSRPAGTREPKPAQQYKTAGPGMMGSTAVSAFVAVPAGLVPLPLPPETAPEAAELPVPTPPIPMAISTAPPMAAPTSVPSQPAESPTTSATSARRRKAARIAVLCGVAIIGALVAVAVLDPGSPSHANNASRNNQTGSVANVVTSGALTSAGSASGSTQTTGTSLTPGSSAPVPASSTLAPAGQPSAGSSQGGGGGNGGGSGGSNGGVVPTTPASKPKPTTPPPPPTYGTPAGPGSGYVSGSETTVPGCAAWFVNPQNTALDATVSSGSNASCTAEATQTAAMFGSLQSQSLSASDGSENTEALFTNVSWMGDYTYTVHICVSNQSGTKSCSPSFDWDSASSTAKED